MIGAPRFVGATPTFARSARSGWATRGMGREAGSKNKQQVPFGDDKQERQKQRLVAGMRYGLLGGFSVRLVLFGCDLVGALLDGAHEGEEDDVADGAGVGEEHSEAVDAYAFACGGREAVAEGSDVVFVHLVGFVVTLFLLVELV